jgi:aspartyl-tRNA(Asn)/glutamyl-tRNA(Gln) amidotransferase subunit C
MAAFTQQQIEHIAKLARLDLTPDEKQKFAEQFGSILEYVAMIQNVQVPPELAQEAVTPPLMREDVPEVSGILPESFSPYVEHHHFKVPKVIE